MLFRSRFPDLPKLKPEELAELRTLAQIVEHMGGKLGPGETSSTPVIAPMSTTLASRSGRAARGRGRRGERLALRSRRRDPSAAAPDVLYAWRALFERSVRAASRTNRRLERA